MINFCGKKQVESTVSKVSKGIGMLRRIKSCAPKRTLINVYNAIILPYFDYCSFVWTKGPCRYTGRDSTTRRNFLVFES